METPAILYPVFVLVFLTFAVAFWMGGTRFAAVNSRQVKMRYFELRTGGELPARVVKASNNYINLLELPVLFYALVALLLVTDRADALHVTLAWVFVATRIVHSLIHLSFNAVTPRFLAFATGLVVLLAMWVRFLMQAAG